MLPVFSRLFEKLVFNQLHQYLNDRCFANSNQSGFRKLHSTATCLLRNTHDWYIKIEFDTFDHQIICRKLESSGVLHRELAWFGSYLLNRDQHCRINGIDLQSKSINIVLPQGLCLCPLLFLVYINDIPRAIKNSTTSMYADDTSLCFKSKDLSRLNEALNEDLSRLDAWLISNKLSLNVAKTQSCWSLPELKRKLLISLTRIYKSKLMERSLKLLAKLST